MNTQGDPRHIANDDVRIGLDIEGPGVTLARLIQATSHLVRILNAVDRSLTGRTSPVLDWVVTGMEAGSAHLEAKPRALTKQAPVWAGRMVVKRVAEGVEHIRRGERPADFPEGAVNDVLGLVKLLDHAGITQIAIRANGEPVPITRALAIQHAVDTADRLVSIGALEGRLETMSVHNHNWFNLYDALTGAPVRCSYDEDLYEKVHTAFRQGVLVWGQISRTSDGQPVSIRVSDITSLPADDELVGVEEAFGVFGKHA